MSSELMDPVEFADKFVASLSLKQKVALLNVFENPDFIMEKNPKRGNSYMYLIDKDNLKEWVSALKDLMSARLDRVQSFSDDSVVSRLSVGTLTHYDESFVDRSLTYTVMQAIAVSPYHVVGTEYYFDEYIEMLSLDVQNRVKNLPPPFQIKSMY